MVVDHFCSPDLSELDQGLPADHQELLILGMVPMVALGDSALGDVHRELAAFSSTKNLGEAAAVVGVHLQRIAELAFRQVAQVGAVQHLLEAVTHIGYREGCPALPECLEELHNSSQLHRMDGGDLAEIVLNQDITLECREESLDHIIDVHQAHDHLRVVDRDGKVPCDVVAEGGYRTVVVGPAPLAEDVGKAEYIHDRARLLGIAEEQVLTGLLAPSIRVVQLCLDGRGDEHRAGIVVPLQGGKQGVGEAEVALHEFLLLLGPIYSGKVENKFTVLGIRVQKLRIGVDVVEIQIFVSLASQFGDEVFPHEAV